MHTKKARLSRFLVRLFPFFIFILIVWMSERSGYKRAERSGSSAECSNHRRSPDNLSDLHKLRPGTAACEWRSFILIATRARLCSSLFAFYYTNSYLTKAAQTLWSISPHFAQRCAVDLSCSEWFVFWVCINDSLLDFSFALMSAADRRGSSFDATLNRVSRTKISHLNFSHA